jgi:hypothetical protein
VPSAGRGARAAGRGVRAVGLLAPQAPQSGRGQPPRSDLLGQRAAGPRALAGRGLQTRKLAQVADHGGHGLALDVLHRVVVDTLLAADREDRHDVGVMQLGRGLGLGLEPPQPVGVERRGERQHLQRHLTVERDLLGLVDDSHSAPADLAEDAEVAQHRCRWTILHPLDRGPCAGFSLDPPGQAEDAQAGPQLVGDCRVLGRQAIQIH